ncbi:MAG: sigma-70 family RNA polymerase sigma factor [Saprospiraceae bacterium]
MSKKSYTINQITDDLFRRESGKITSVLISIFGIKQLELAEDIVQDSFVSAIKNWRLNGMPDKPAAWLMQVAKNKAIDHLRRNRRQIDLDISDHEKTLIQSGYTFEPVFNHIWEQIKIEDEMLQMMFACCHESISVENQITLMLKTLCGFSTLEISRALITPEDTISKRLYRTKEFFRANHIKPEITSTFYESKLDSVLKAVYLLFNEGYLSTHSDQSIREDLIHQAIYLGSILCDHPKTKTAKVYAAMSLMCFHAARLNSRLDTSGDIILLAQQDRSLWDQTLIARAMMYLDQSATGDQITSYHLEAAIAYEHCIAPTYEQTNWEKILQFYDWLESIHPNPIVSLNRMVALSKCHTLSSTLETLKQSSFLSLWQAQPVYHALLGDLYANNNTPQAWEHYRKASELTHSIAEKKLMQKKIDGLDKTER